MNELKPCPFCGSQNIKRNQIDIPIIFCEDCSCSLKSNMIDKIENQWNDREYEDHRYYGELGEANLQVKLLIQEKSLILKKLSLSK